jgi:hypothetical protein
MYEFSGHGTQNQRSVGMITAYLVIAGFAFGFLLNQTTFLEALFGAALWPGTLVLFGVLALVYRN